MPLHETEAFVLRTFSLKEADKVCVFFTRADGRLYGHVLTVYPYESSEGAPRLMLSHWEWTDHRQWSVADATALTAENLATIAALLPVPAER